MTKKEALKLREKIVDLAKSITDEEIVDYPTLCDQWKTETSYEAGDRVRYSSILYKCLQPHTSQDTWTPAAAPSLWVRIDDPTIEWPEWRQPTGATDAYPKGAKVSHNDKHWTSDIDNNVWEPGVYGWTEATA